MKTFHHYAPENEDTRLHRLWELGLYLDGVQTRLACERDRAADPEKGTPIRFAPAPEF